MATPENKVKDAVKRELKKRGIWYYMPVQNGMGVVGIPDIIGCWDGWFVGIECKAPGKMKSVTVNQQRRLSEIEAAKGLALVIDNVETLRVILDNLTEMKQGLKDGNEEKRIIQIN